VRKLGEIKLVIFDMDGTLIDPRIDVANALNVSLTHFNLSPLSYQDIFGMIRNGMKNLMERALPSSHLAGLREAASVYRHHYDQHLLDNTTLYASVRETLEALGTLKKVVVSNKREKPLQSILEGFNLKDHFEMVLGSDTMEKRKPSPIGIMRALDKLRVLPEQTLMVGDSPEDIQAGRAAGTHTCGVTYGYRTQKDLIDEKPDFIINHLTSLLNILTK